MLSMKKNVKFEKIGFYVTDSRFYEKFKSCHPQINSPEISVLKEWSLNQKSEGLDLDFESLNRYEQKIGFPNLWAALVADRTLYNGKKYAYTQDYNSNLTHEEMLRVLQVGLEKIDEFFNNIKPDLIISFQCVTLGEYLSFLFAKSKNIKFLNIRPTRIKNYVYAGEGILEPSPSLKNTYENFLKNGMEETLEKKTDLFLKDVRLKNAKYEGVISPSNSSPGSQINSKRKFPIFKVLSSAFKAIKEDFNFKYSDQKYDNSIYSSVDYLYHQKIKRPLIARRMNTLFRKTYVTEAQLKNINYAFFPLHTEPEVTLNLYSRPYINQIEAIRLISLNLPVGMKLIIKEHPVSVGKRKINYYKKLLEIPNLLIAQPEIESRNLISNASLISVICGSIGLEAVFMRVPLIILGRAPFNFLPNKMIRYITNPDKIGFEIKDLLKTHEHNEMALKCYIGANIQDSTPVDFYSILSGRKEAFREGSKLNDKSLAVEYNNQIKRLSEYLLKRFYSY